MMGSVFAMQGIGQFAAAIVALVVTAGFKESLMTAKTVAVCSGVCLIAVDKMWRVVIGFGAVPACVALYYRLTIPETPRYTFDVVRDVVKAGEDINAYIKGQAEGHPDEVQRAAALKQSGDELRAPKASIADFVAYYSQWKNGKVLLGTAGSWFFLDIGASRLSIASFPLTNHHQWQRTSADLGGSLLWLGLEQLHHPDSHWLGRWS
jgi:MFS transporter, PHS family, inorganic phosphate transporter